MSDSPLKRALKAIERLESRVRELESTAREPIAICGVGCRFPQAARTPDAFWQQLVNGVDSVSVVPPSRWDIDRYYSADPDEPGKMATKWGAFVDELDRFDASFFGITPREASSLDPQQRMLLECTHEALEAAGCPPSSLASQPVGVFVGIINDDYGDLQLEHGGVADIDAYFGSGNSSSIAAGRLAYVLGTAGPAVSVDTACSSSLVALHLACQSLHTGESDVALAGGVNVTLLPEGTVALSRYKMMALDGRCKTFDASADGYVRGEGCAVLVLKRLSDALAAGDPIFATVRATAVNQDGASSGLTAPNGPAQEAVIRAALAAGGVGAADVGYIEAHGTGTSLGDPIEIQALHAALGTGRKQPLLVGSVKTNVGHLESAAGMAGLVKAALAVRHGQIPPHLHLNEPNPFIPWDRVNVEIPRTLTPWPADTPRIAGVSSFGFSGTNGHVLIEEPPAESLGATTAPQRSRQVFCFSAKDEAALTELAAAHSRASARLRRCRRAGRHLLHGNGRAGPSRLARRGRHRRRGRGGGCARSLRRRGRPLGHAWQGPGRRSAAHRVPVHRAGGAVRGHGEGTLYDAEPVFRDALDRCAAGLEGVLEQPLLDVMFGDKETSPIDRTVYTQPSLFAIEWSLAELWESWGVRPTAMLGHSVGELVAAQRAGVFSLEDGLKLIAERARLMGELPEGGSMAATFIDESRARALIAESGCGDRVSIAAVNGPTNTVLSGDEEAIDALLTRLAEEKIRTKKLVVSHAFHSARMEPMLERYQAFADGLAMSPPVRRVISNRTGEVAGAELATGAYWAEHVREEVRFADGVTRLAQLGCDVWLEVGPQPTLIGMAERCLDDDAPRHWIPSLRQGARRCHDPGEGASCAVRRRRRRRRESRRARTRTSLRPAADLPVPALPALVRAACAAGDHDGDRGRRVGRRRAASTPAPADRLAAVGDAVRVACRPGTVRVRPRPSHPRHRAAAGDRLRRGCPCRIGTADRVGRRAGEPDDRGAAGLSSGRATHAATRHRDGCERRA